MRPLFHDMALQAVPVFFMKFKEKRIVEDIMENMNKILLCVQLNEILDAIQAALKAEKTAAAKVNMMVYLERAIRTTY